jgi:hypothetical protein
MRAAAPAVDPKSTLLLFSSSNALLLPRLCVHATEMPSLARSCSRNFLSFSNQAHGVVIRIVEPDGRRLHRSLAAAARHDRRNDQNCDRNRELCPVLIVHSLPLCEPRRRRIRLPLVANFVALAPVSPRSCAADIHSRPVRRTGR